VIAKMPYRRTAVGYRQSQENTGTERWDRCSDLATGTLVPVHTDVSMVLSGYVPRCSAFEGAANTGASVIPTRRYEC
jgi:hypothetical protein